MTWEYYIKSKKAEHYKKMVSESLYHPPAVKVDVDEDNTLVINHIFEGKPLFKEYIGGTLMGLEYLWGNRVTLFTHEPVAIKQEGQQAGQESVAPKVTWRRVKYTMHEKKMVRVVID
jgi:stage V sporulation protein R